MIPHKNIHPRLPTSPQKPLRHIVPLEHCAALFNGSSDPVLILSLNLQIEFANIAAEKFFNFSQGQFKGRYFKDGLTPESLQKIHTAIKQVNRQSAQFRLELDAIDGHRQRVTMEVTIFPICEHNHIKNYHVTLRDVSQERQIEELIREAQKMEAIQYFVSGTTKELQHPLLAILKRIESLENKYRGRSFEYVSFKEFTHIMEFLEVMRKQIKSCYDTTTKLSSLNKKRLKFESNYCQANAVIREVIRLKEQNFRNANIKIRLRLSEKLSPVGLGELELGQVISHIIDNAIHAMPAQGQVTVVTTNQAETHQVKIEISDTGVGISPEDLPHIFEPFFTTKQRGAERSAGLGLSIVYSLVKAAQGQIRVKSSLRKGTSVYLVFPLADHGKTHHRLRK